MKDLTKLMKNNFMQENLDINSNPKLNQFRKLNFKTATLPVYAEVFARYPWVFYGNDNLMPDYLIGQYNACAIHKAIIDTKVNQIMGDGIVSLDNPMSTILPVNGNETIGEIMRKCALDYMLFGGFALNCVWSNDRTQIAEIYHVDFSRLRSGKLNPETDKVECYYYSPQWSAAKKFPPQEIAAFGKDVKDPIQIFYHKDYQPNMTYYPVPDYSGGLPATEIFVEIQNFHKNNLRKGMSPSLFISMNNGIPGPEEQRIIVRGLEEQYGGTDGAGQAIVSFNESKELAPEITQIQRNENDNYYSVVYDDIIRSILSGHRVSSGELFGITTAGKLGSKDEVINHTEYFRKMVIMPYQNKMIPVFNKIMSLYSGKQTTFEVKPLSIYEIGNITEEPKVK